MRRVNVMGNGDHATLFKKGTEGELLVCNMPPVELTKDEVFASCMVDFKMMLALEENKVRLDHYDWLLHVRVDGWR